MKREHVEHYVATLDDRELADQLTMLRLKDAEDLEEVLLARQRAKKRQGRVLFGSNNIVRRQRNFPTVNITRTNQDVLYRLSGEHQEVTVNKKLAPVDPREKGISGAPMWLRPRPPQAGPGMQKSPGATRIRILTGAVA